MGSPFLLAALDIAAKTFKLPDESLGAYSVRYFADRASPVRWKLGRLRHRGSSFPTFRVADRRHLLHYGFRNSQCRASSSAEAV